VKVWRLEHWCGVYVEAGNENETGFLRPAKQGQRINGLCLNFERCCGWIPRSFSISGDSLYNFSMDSSLALLLRFSGCHSTDYLVNSRLVSELREGRSRANLSFKP
jgi:hypothetical protein